MEELTQSTNTPKINNRVVVYELGYEHLNVQGTIKEIKGQRIGILKDSTTTGCLTWFSKRKNGEFVRVGDNLEEFYTKIIFNR